MSGGIGPGSMTRLVVAVMANRVVLQEGRSAEMRLARTRLD
jgi:hypothetical protein